VPDIDDALRRQIVDDLEQWDRGSTIQAEVEAMRMSALAKIQPLLDAIDDSECLSAEDYKITVY
jgi:ornithine cyclodeaminase/alanine dehydrogenase-like protein (mu-crystallin family)